MTNIEQIREAARAANARPLAESDKGIIGPRQRGIPAPRSPRDVPRPDHEPDLVLGPDAPDVGARICEGFALRGDD